MQTEQQDMFVHCEWWPSEQTVLLPPEEISTAVHAEKYRYVVKSSRPGPWQNRNNPPLVGIMNAADHSGVFKNTRILVVIKGVQTGVTEGAYNILFKRMDGSAQNALLAMENERKVRRVSKQRIQESIRRHGRLAAQLSDNPDDTTNYSVTMRTGFNLNIGWAGSQAAMASDPCETVILDEVDKYDTPMNIEEAKDRTTTFHETGLCAIFSTPGFEGGPITVEFDNCDAHFDYHVECPDCGHVQPMDFDHFWWPEKDDPKKPGGWKLLAGKIARERLARYACAGCGSLWDDYMRDQAVLRGLKHFFHGWKMREDVGFPVAAGFKFPSWISPFKSLSKVVSRYLIAKEPGQPGKLQGWHNNEAAEPFIEGEEAVNGDDIYARRATYAAEVPMGALLLMASVDVQNERLEIEVKGWGPGEESWGIVHKIIQGSFLDEKTQTALDDFLLKTFRHESGELMYIKRAFIDSGGKYPSQVYAFCKAREGRGVYAIKGSSDTRADILDGRLVRRKDAVFQKIGVTACKDILFGRLALTDHGPGYMHFNMGYDKEYFNQLTSERVSKSKQGKRLYELIPGRRNEAIDLNNYNLAALRLYAPDWEALKRSGVGAIDRSRLVYRNHRREKHLDDSISLRADLPIVLCCDFGKNPLVWVLCQSDRKRIWCFDEIMIRNAATMDMGMEVLRRYGSHKPGFIVYGSAAGTVRTLVGKSEYAILKELGFTRQAIKIVNPAEIDRINAINARLEDLAGQTMLTYNSNCIMLRKDFNQAIWIEDMSEIDRTDFGRGNAAEALGYYINYEWPLRTAAPNPSKKFWK